MTQRRSVRMNHITVYDEHGVMWSYFRYGSPVSCDICDKQITAGFISDVFDGIEHDGQCRTICRSHMRWPKGAA